MRTTVDLPGALLTQAKILAVQRGLTLRDLIAAGLRSEILRVGGAPHAARSLPSITVALDAPVLAMTPGQISGALSSEQEQDDAARFS